MLDLGWLVYLYIYFGVGFVAGVGFVFMVRENVDTLFEHTNYFVIAMLAWPPVLMLLISDLCSRWWKRNSNLSEVDDNTTQGER